MQCFHEFTTNMYQYKFYFIRHIILNLCERHRQYKNSDVKAARETDTTSGKKKLYKNFIYNEFTLNFPSAYIDRN